MPSQEAYYHKVGWSRGLVPYMFTYRPQCSDAGDDFIIDCAMNGRAGLVTSNIRHFHGAAERLGFPLMTTEQSVKALEEQ